MIYTVENKFLRIEVNSLGAQLFSVRSKKTGVEYLWQGDPAYWTGRAYNLFPIIGRMVDGKYTYGENTYSIRAHGLARYYEFSAADRSATRLSLRLSSTEETLSQYPFAFDFTVTFELKNSALYLTYSVKNMGTETMPFAFGGHPGINVPFDGGNFEDYYLEFEEKTPVVQHTLSENKFMSGEVVAYPLLMGKRLPLKHGLFDNDAIVLGRTCRSAKLTAKHTDRFVKICYPDFKYFGLWHAVKTDAPYVCLEPWTALPATEGKIDELSQKADMRHLPAGETYTTTWSLEIGE